MDVAARQGVELLSLTEHNHLGSVSRARARARQRGVRYLSGVEIDAEWKGRTLHFMGIGFDEDFSPLAKLVEQNFSRYASHFALYLEKIEASVCPTLGQELAEGFARRYAGNPSMTLNMCYARDFAVSKGIFPNAQAFKEKMEEFKKEIVAESGPQAFAPFASVGQVRDAIQEAGGVVLLGHVGQYFPGDQRKQLDTIRELVAEGIDGFELYHPYNLREDHFDSLADEAQRLGCVVSAGTDCHDVLRQWPSPIGCRAATDKTVAKMEEVLARRGRPRA